MHDRHLPSRLLEMRWLVTCKSGLLDLLWAVGQHSLGSVRSGGCLLVWNVPVPLVPPELIRRSCPDWPLHLDPRP